MYYRFFFLCFCVGQVVVVRQVVVVALVEVEVVVVGRTVL
jgi:hypothetical protein